MRHLLIALAVSAGVAAQGQDLEREAREIEAALIAPCCFSQQVSVHQSPAAEEIRRDIRRRLAAGETRAGILAAYRAEYGKRVLAEPPAEGFDRILKFGPVVALALTAVLVGVIVGRFTRRRAVSAAAAPAGAAELEDRYAAQLDDQLRDLD